MDYHDPGGQNLARDWYKAQIAAVRAAVLYAVNEVESTEDLEKNGTFNPLVRDHRGLFTLRISVEIDKKRRQFRPVGFWSLNAGELILAGGCEKSGRVTIPPGVYDNVLDIQLAYYHNGSGTIYAHSF
jgi:hypothetical protein